MTRDGADAEGRGRIAAFRKELQALGWLDGRNLEIDERWAGTDRETIERMAKELVAKRVDVIVTQNTPATAAVLRHTRTTPTVFFQASDPVGSGFVAALRRPGGSVTGFTDLEASLAGKWLQLLHEVTPRVSRVALLFNPQTAPYATYYMTVFEAAAPKLGLRTMVTPLRERADVARTLAAFAGRSDTGVIVLPEAFTGRHSAEIASQSNRHALPAIYPYRFFVTAGGLLSYGIDLVAQYARAASYVDRILKGDLPAEMPVQQPTKFELVINLKTARALGLTVPTSLLARADEVIE